MMVSNKKKVVQAFAPKENKRKQKQQSSSEAITIWATAKSKNNRNKTIINTRTPARRIKQKQNQPVQ